MLVGQVIPRRPLFNGDWELEERQQRSWPWGGVPTISLPVERREDQRVVAGIQHGRRPPSQDMGPPHCLSTLRRTCMTPHLWESGDSARRKLRETALRLTQSCKTFK